MFYPFRAGVHVGCVFAFYDLGILVNSNTREKWLLLGKESEAWR
jgi:hypothetical protein